MIKRSVLSYCTACALGLYAGYEAHHLHEARHPSNRSFTVTLRDGKIEILPPGDDTGAHRHKEGPPSQGAVTIITSTSPGGMFATSSSDVGPLVRVWGRLPDGRHFLSEYHRDGALPSLLPPGTTPRA